jgi:hypothetical protein
MGFCQNENYKIFPNSVNFRVLIIHYGTAFKHLLTQPQGTGTYYLFIYLFVYLFICLFIYLSIYLFLLSHCALFIYLLGGKGGRCVGMKILQP